MSKLTAQYIKHKTDPKDKEYRVPDGGGLFLRIRPSGSKSWLFCYRIGSDRTWRQMTLGLLKDVSLKEAREQLKELKPLVKDGIDPRHVRAATKADNIQAMTMQSLFDAWIEFTASSDQISVTWLKRHQDRWRLHLKKPLGHLLARDISRSHLAHALDAMACKGIREETRKALTTLNLMLDYGLTRQYVEQNPARMLKPKDFSATANTPRERVLTIDELLQLWLALDQVTNNGTKTFSVVTTSAIKMLILTGARRGEVAGMRWSELNLDQGTWKLPSDRTKNGCAHIIYLAPLAIKIIKSLQPISGESSFVFDTGRYVDGGHIHQDTLTGVISRLCGKAKGKNKKTHNLDMLMKMDPFTIHDLRRSAATGWGEYLKAEPHIIERMLNHQPLNKLIATYQRAVYADEQKTVWLNWGRVLEQKIDHIIE